MLSCEVRRLLSLCTVDNVPIDWTEDCSREAKTMKRIIVVLISLLLMSAPSLGFSIHPLVAGFSQSPSTEWSRAYGGVNADEAKSVIQTSDGGYIVGGSTKSFGHGGWDMWLVKTDASGNPLWNKTYGSTADEWGYQVIQATEGGYVFVGTRWNQTRSAADLYMVKTNLSGDAVWDLDYIPDSSGGSADWGDVGHIIQASDGNFTLCGSVRHHPLHSTYDWDAWVIKVSVSGQVVWDKPYFSSSDDGGGSIIQTSDGGYAFVGATLSWGGSGGKIWLVKIDANGTQQWVKTYGGEGGPTDNAFSIVQTLDGGYTIAGLTYSFGAAGQDFCLIKTDSAGNQTWAKTFGGANDEAAYSMIPNTDGGYLLAGYTRSFGAGGSDFWLVKTDSLGNMQWNKTYGGANDDLAYSVIQTSDGGYAIAGCTYSFGAGSSDFWLVKLASSGRLPKTWIVDVNGSGDFPTIQAAVNAAIDGDTIFVRNGTYYEHLTINETLQLIGENRDSTIIDGEYKDPPEMRGSVVLVVANNLKMSGFTIQHCREGGNAICLDGYVNMIFSGNIITGCNEGIRILHSSSNIISDNIIRDCYYNTGLGFNWAYNNTVYGNLIANGNVGIGGNHWNNTFFNNTIRDNKGGWAGWGISDNFYDCVFFHNNIIDNGHQVHNTNPNSNIWDDGYPSGGNYWSDYSGTDANADGIGDAPYVIDQQNIDHYPLMSMFPSPSESIPPVAEFTWSPLDPVANETITLDASISKNGWNGTNSVPISTYSWDFGDNSASNGQVVTHAYATSGNFTVRLNVTDVQGLWNTTEKQMQVGQPRAPLALFVINPETTHVNEVVEFNASGSVSGWNGTHENPIVSYTWDFGDGNGTSSVEPTINHSYAEAGVFNATLTVSDSGNMNSSFSRVILVTMPTYVSISTSSTSTVIGFTVNINGTLQDVYGNGLQNEPVVLYYTFAGVSQWFPMTSSITDSLGYYSAQWIPTATGTFQIKAEWNGNATYSGTSGNVTLSSVSAMNQYVFSVESNSTISSLAFNTTSSELSFTASGSSGTSGYVKVTVAKSLVADVTSIKVYLDNNQTSYSIESAGDSWLLTFNYTHSTHEVRVDLSTIVVPEFSNNVILLLLAILAVALMVSKKGRLAKLHI